MKLVSRVSVFFLSALAVVLFVYSAVFYTFVRSWLVYQFEQELQSSLSSLVAAVEIEPEEVKWQPLEHTIALGAASGPDEIRWVVIGDRTQIVEQSQTVTHEFIAQAKQIATQAANSGNNQGALDDGRLIYQRLAAVYPDHTDRELDEFDEIVVVVTRSDTQLSANLYLLLLLVCTVPVAVWLLAAAAGRWFCGRALQPLLEMSNQVRSMRDADHQARLPVGETGDELAELARSFNTLLDHRHRAFQQQRRFTGDAAHELRTPLTVLIGEIDVALRRTRSPEEYQETLRLLRDQSAQLHKIVESLLFLARAENDADLPDSETVHLQDWLPDYLKRWDHHPRRQDIKLESAGMCDQVVASRVLLSRLLDNLVENALKYSSPGSPVVISTANEDGEVQVAVQDQGRGIAVEDQAEIFEPFYRSRVVRDAQITGTGLGLAIAARIAAAFGGRLDCSSEDGRGSRFTLHLAPLGERPLRTNGTPQAVG